MYTPVSGIEKFLAEHPEKTFKCCEYSHAMGNICGAMHKYTELSDREPRYQGGFIFLFILITLLMMSEFYIINRQ